MLHNISIKRLSTMYTIRSQWKKSFGEVEPLVEVSSPGIGVPLNKNWSKGFCVIPEPFKDIADEVYNFDVKSDDVFIVTFPKCGTTWAQEAAWMIYKDLDYEKSKEVNTMERICYLEGFAIIPNMPIKSTENARLMETPRVIKSHLPAHLLPHQIWEKKPKIIYVARNPKDCLVSMHHFYKGVRRYNGTIDQLTDDFINGSFWYMPYWDHILDFWKMRNEPNILFITYEDMKRDLGSVLQKMANFLEKPPLNKDQLATLMEYLSFDNMKNNSNVTKYLRELVVTTENFEFMRNGKTGSYRKDLTPEIERKIDEWELENLQELNITSKDIFGDI